MISQISQIFQVIEDIIFLIKDTQYKNYKKIN
jgi:hypothetical protein